jgi:flagellar basal-body rod modification protein FlgD
MSISATESTAGLFGSTTASAPATNDVTDKDTFLKLMVAQLKYQDPMNPTDSAEFLSQSAQFSALEQMTTVAEQSAQAIVLQLAFGASSLVGKTVTYMNGDGEEVTAAVSAVRFEPTGPVLEVGEDTIGMGDVVTVHGDGSTTTPPADVPTTETPEAPGTETEPDTTPGTDTQAS